jgi:hypothetical protein
MSRQVYLLGVGVVLVAGALLLTDALLWESAVTEANVQRIRPGMTLEEVEGILGPYPLPDKGPWGTRAEVAEAVRSLSPSDDAKRAVRREAFSIGRLDGGKPEYIPLFWKGKDGTAVVVFRAGGRAGGAGWLWESRPPVRSPLARLRAWLGW